MSRNQVKTPRSRFWGQILLLAVAQAFLMFAYGAILPILPYYLSEFNAGAFEYGILVATFDDKITKSPKRKIL